MKWTILLIVTTIVFSCQKQKNEKQENLYIQEDTIVVNKDLVKAEYRGYRTSKEMSESDYMPANDFYEQRKTYYPSGMIKKRGKYMSGVAFGLHEYFDKNGSCIKIIDEDKKFGVIRREDILQLLEEEGWFNRQTCQNIITNDPILPTTNSAFYFRITKHMTINFKRSVKENIGNETEPPKWFITIYLSNGLTTRYIIDGNTGDFEKKETFEFEYI